MHRETRHEQQQHQAAETAQEQAVAKEADAQGHAAIAASNGTSASDRAFGHHGIPGGDRNVSMLHINEHHHGEGQATRLGIGGASPELKQASPVYTNDGKPIGTQAAGHVPINAGQICKLVPEGQQHAITCVLSHGSPPGWVPTEHFAHRTELEKLQHTQSTAINHHRHAGHDRAEAGVKRTIRAKPTPAKYEQLFTKPHQQADTANHAHDYFVRGDGRVNLLLDLPTWEKNGHSVGERLGSASDIIAAAEVGDHSPPATAVFHQTAGPAHVPLYHHNSETQVDHLTFVYGYVVNSAGEQRLGWVNQYLLD